MNTIRILRGSVLTRKYILRVVSFPNIGSSWSEEKAFADQSISYF